MSKNIYEKIAKATASGGGNFIRQGKGTLIVQALKLPKLFNGDTFIAEFLVKESESIPDAVDKNGKPETANPVGAHCSYVQQLEKFQSAPGNVKAFVEALDGEQDTDETAFVSTLQAYVNEDPKAGEVNPGRGFEISYETYQRLIQKGPNAGKPITLVRWGHVDLSEGQVQANRDLLDGKKPAAPKAA